MSTAHHAFREMGSRPIPLVAAVDANNVNLFTLAGSPAGAVIVVYTINPGVWIGSTSTGSPALSITGFNAGSRIIVRNQGVVAGCGANGNSNVGGDAISLGNNIELDNTTGNIGGGGGGGARGVSEGSGLAGADGGGGGGGRGSTGGAAGANSITGGATGGTATAGTRTARGVGAAGGNNPTYSNFGGAGGGGGDLGQPGDTSSPSSPHSFTSVGGAAGFAIRLNSKTVTWLGGNVPSQVFGSVA